MNALTTDGFVFVYGTLKEGYGANYKLHREKKLGTFVSESKFRIFGDGFPMAILSKDGHPLRGEVYTLNAMTLPILDAYEGYPHFYGRDKLLFKEETTESRVAAWMYHIKDYRGTTFHHPLKPGADGILDWSK